MKKIKIDQIEYDWLFSRWPESKQAYDWYYRNKDLYPELNQIKLFKKYLYRNQHEGRQQNWWIIGAYPETNEYTGSSFILNLYVIQQSNNFNRQFSQYYCNSTIQSMTISQNKIIDIPFKDYLFNLSVESYLTKQDIIK